MSSEFINDGDADASATQSENIEEVSLFSYTNISIAFVVALALVVLVIMFSSDTASYFQGSFPERSDIGADKFDLQKEVSYLTERQMNNLGYA
jgi:CRISPR/Cas system-associated endonuclease Cas1